MWVRITGMKALCLDWFWAYQLMLQLLAKGGDIFTGGREYYNHPNYRAATNHRSFTRAALPECRYIPTTGVAQGIKFLEKTSSPLYKINPMEAPVVICCLSDASVTEGEMVRHSSLPHSTSYPSFTSWKITIGTSVFLLLKVKNNQCIWIHWRIQRHRKNKHQRQRFCWKLYGNAGSGWFC